MIPTIGLHIPTTADSPRIRGDDPRDGLLINLERGFSPYSRG